MAGMVIIPWYATGLREKAFGEALEELAPTALRYGATSYAVYRSRDDHYKFQQMAAFNEHLDWDRYGEGPEMRGFKTRYAGWFQIPLLYSWWDELAVGASEAAAASVNEAAAAGAASEAA